MNWETEVEFCPDMGNLSTLNMSDLIGESLFHSDGYFRRLILTRYIQMQQFFGGVPFNDRQWNLMLGDITYENVVEAFRPKKDARLKIPITHIKTDDDDIKKVFAECNLGHDLPIWVCKKDASQLGSPRYRVMLVAQDPRRMNDSAGALYLSSPFGLHSADYRDGAGGVLPYKIVDALVADGAAVYVTDALKIFARCNDFVRCHCKNILKDSIGILDKEIERFDPDVIMFIGIDAARIASPGTIEGIEMGMVPIPFRFEKEICNRNRVCYIARHTSRLNQCRECLVQAGIISKDDHSKASYFRYYVDPIVKVGSIVK